MKLCHDTHTHHKYTHKLMQLLSNCHNPESNSRDVHTLQHIRYTAAVPAVSASPLPRLDTAKSSVHGYLEFIWARCPLEADVMVAGRSLRSSRRSHKSGTVQVLHISTSVPTAHQSTQAVDQAIIQQLKSIFTLAPTSK